MSLALWAALGEAGFTRMLSAEAADDAPGLADAVAVVSRVAESSAAVPLAETLLAHYVLAPQENAADAPCTLVIADTGDAVGLQRKDGVWRVSGRARRIPWARHCRSVVIVAMTEAGPMAAGVSSESATLIAGANVAGEPRDDLVFDATAVATAEVSPLSPREIWALGSLMRSAQMTGAIARILAMTIDHASSRRQFGRPLVEFQAIKHSIARIAEQHAAAVAAVDYAAGEAQVDAASLALPMAKIRVGEAASAAAAIAHQVFGAIGYTREHELQAHTRGIWSWRDEFGSEDHWSGEVGRQVCAAGPQGLWAAVLGHSP